MNDKMQFINPPIIGGGGAWKEQCCTGKTLTPVLPATLALLAGQWKASNKKPVLIDLITQNNKTFHLGEKTILTLTKPTQNIDLDWIKFMQENCPIVNTVSFPDSIAIDNHLPHIKYPKTINFGKKYKVKQDAPSHYDSLPLEKYGVIPLYSMFGCPNQCIFCAWANTKPVFRKTKNIKADIHAIKHLDKTIFLMDTNFKIDKNKNFLLEELKKNGVSWVTDIKADSRDHAKLYARMKEAGCKKITLGVETPLNKNLKKLKKNVSVNQIEREIKNIKKAGIKVNASFLFGFPWDGNKEKEAIISFIKKNKPDNIGVNSPRVYSGTELAQYNNSLDPEYIEKTLNEIQGTTIKYRQKKDLLLHAIKHPQWKYLNYIKHII